MAIATFDDLSASVARFLNRDDLTAVVPDFIALAEAQIARDVRHWRMESRDAITLDAQFVAFPADWVETVRLEVAADGYRALRLASRDELQTYRARGEDVAGVPTMYAHVAGQFELWPTPDGSYSGSLVYLQRIPALGPGAQTNWLLTEAPDAYLYGALIQSAPYLSEDQRITVWASLYTAAVERLNTTSDAAKYSGTALRMLPPR
jgi:hypothetical protein